MRSIRLIAVLGLALGVLLPGISANAEWKQESNNWSYIDDSGNKATGWQQIDGNWYYMWSNGEMAMNTWIENNDKWYYLGSSGAMVYNTIIDGYVIGSWIGYNQLDNNCSVMI